MNSQERYSGAVSLIMSQTNYSKETASEKLELWDGNYMNVIKEYLNPNFQKKNRKNGDNQGVSNNRGHR